MRGVVLACALLVACGDDDGGTDAAVDVGPDTVENYDIGPPDTGFDAGPPPPAMCDICRRDSDCGEGLCLILADGERGCGTPCETAEDCPSGAECAEEIPGEPLQCRPSANTCVDTPPGTECGGDPACSGRYDVCAEHDEGLFRYCTTECEVDADCPIGLHRCRESDGRRLCIADVVPPLVRCEAFAADVTPCESDGTCADASARCLGTGSIRVCAPPAAGGCPDGWTAVTLPDADERCVPDGSRDDTPCECLVEDPGAMLDDAAAELSRGRCDLGFTFWPSIIPEISRDPFRLDFTDELLGYWPAVVPYGEALAECPSEMLPSALLLQAAEQADLDVSAPTARDGDLLAELEGLLTDLGETPDTEALRAQVSSLDTALAGAIARLVGALRDAHTLREEALARIGDQRDRYFLGGSAMILGGLPGLNMSRADDRGALRGDVDVAKLAEAAHVLADAVERFPTNLAGSSGELTVETPIGRIAVRGSEANVYPDDLWHSTALLVDLGGNDSYRFPVGATTSATHGLAVAVDLGGMDDYGYDVVADPGDTGPDGSIRLPSDADGRQSGAQAVSLSQTARQGAGLLGVGILADFGPEDDRYRSPRMSQGWGALGVGILWDRGGDDGYLTEAGGQGASAFGIGLLVDAEGNDRYGAYRYAQGFAYAHAVGWLHDQAGDDEYLLHPTDNLYPASQDRTSNASLGQGAGFGRRADFLPDGLFMSGGLGVLRDCAGNDQYVAGIFAQATGFWFGTGLLLENGGNDTYDGQWYVQGGAAHFAVSMLLEQGGDDVYNLNANRQNVVLGGGHDFSIAWHVDREGDDEYHAPGLCYGSGNDGGTGIFLDQEGVDTYEASRDFSFGNANTPPEDAFRRREGTVGIFLEADGADVYDRPMVDPVANDATWTQRRHVDDESEEGVGIDRSGGRPGI